MVGVSSHVEEPRESVKDAQIFTHQIYECRGRVDLRGRPKIIPAGICGGKPCFQRLSYVDQTPIPILRFRVIIKWVEITHPLVERNAPDCRKRIGH